MVVQPYQVGNTLTARMAKGINSTVDEGQTPVIVHGTQDPCVSEIAFAQGRNNGGENVLVQPISIQDVRPVKKAQNGKGWNDDGTAYTVDTHATQGVAQPIPINSMNALRGADADPTTGCGIGEAGEAMFTITKAHSHAVAVGTDCFNGSITGDVAATMGTMGSSVNASGPTVMQSMQVRRLTPVECERLQGFPDGYTNIPWRKKVESPDGPRYKALGNSWAVPVVRWIGNRIQMEINK